MEEEKTPAIPNEEKIADQFENNELDSTYTFHQRLIGVIRLIVPLLCAVLTAFGISADADILLLVLGAVAFVITFVWSWWKDNNMTKAAQKAYLFFLAIRPEKKVE